MKLRKNDPWMSAAEYGRGLRGLTINLLVRDVAAALRFQLEVLGAQAIYSDPDFAVLQHGEAEWMLHADHTYDKHALYPKLKGQAARGIGAELRLHGCDPDSAVGEAKRLGYKVLSEPKDMGHGVREAFIIDQEGYVWVPDMPLSE